MKKKIIKKVELKTVGISLVIFLAFFLIFISVLIYSFNLKDNPVAKVSAKIFPFPASFSFSVGYISVDDLDERLEAVKTFYTNQDFSELGFRVDFSGESGEKRLKIKEKYLLEKLIEEKVIEKLAKERNIKISDELVEEAVRRKMNEYSNEEYLVQNMKNLYSWNIKDFRRNIVKPDLYKENLQQFAAENESDFLESEEIIKKAKESLDGGEAFSEVAKKYSQGGTAQNGGALGWFAKDQILPEISLTVFDMEKGEVSNILQSPLGYHILKVEDKKTEDEQELLRISQIIIRNKSFGDWLSEQKKKFNFYIPLPDFVWNREDGVVEFKSEEMKNFEKETLENPSGDPLFIF